MRCWELDMACDGPVCRNEYQRGVSLLLGKGSNAVTGVIQSPGSATTTDWALALFANSCFYIA